MAQRKKTVRNETVEQTPLTGELKHDEIAAYASHLRTGVRTDSDPNANRIVFASYVDRDAFLAFWFLDRRTRIRQIARGY